MMPSLPQILIILLIVLLLFGAGKLPRVMGDLGKGMRSFKKGLKEDELEEKDQAAIAQRQQDDESSAKN